MRSSLCWEAQYSGVKPCHFKYVGYVSFNSQMSACLSVCMFGLACLRTSAHNSFCAWSHFGEEFKLGDISQ